ncbi:MAG: glycerophosphodiester phosphodiesterase, partial [Bacteroidia bacterium]|nr:glycerophosphodiester phosphodiesterase [Bacteroidia bacterium]
FDLKILEEVKLQSADMKVALLVDENEEIDKKLNQLSYKPEIVSPYFKLLTKETISHYQDKEFKVIPWTVNTEDDMLKMIEYQVDGIITDYPDRLIDLLNK